MFKNLITTLKTQKSTQNQSKVEVSEDQTDPNPQNFPLIPELGQQSIVTGPISLVRYRVVAQMHDFGKQILQCGVSSFNDLPHSRRKVKEIDLNQDKLPKYLEFIAALVKAEVPTYNHILINVYPPGIGIMPHKDGPMYKPHVVVYSLGGPAILSFTPDYSNKTKPMRLLLEDRSIHIFKGDSYTEYLHGIENYMIDCIFLKVAFNEGKPETQSASVSNYHQTQLKTTVNELLSRYKGEYENNFDVNGLKGCITPIIGNSQYNFKVEISRKERMSITFREKFTSIEKVTEPDQ